MWYIAATAGTYFCLDCPPDRANVYLLTGENVMAWDDKS
jgi:hypothetical protein